MIIWLIQRAEPTPHDNNGMQRLMRTGTLASELCDRGHQVLWWTSTFDHYNRKHRFKKDRRVQVSKGFEIQYLRGIGYKNNVSLTRIIDNNLVAVKFKKLAYKEKILPDLILSSIPTSELSLEATKLGKKNNIPVILDIRDLWPDVFLDVLPSYFRRVYPLFSKFIERKVRLSCQNASYITGITNKFVDWGVNHAGRIRNKYDQEFKLGYLPPHIAKVELDRGFKFWEGIGIKQNNNELIVSFIGTIGNVFDFEPIVEAAQILNKCDCNIKFIISGKGEKLGYLKNKCKNLKNIIFTGWIFNYQILSLLKISDIGIAPYMPIPSFLETISNKAAEYLFGSLPIALSVNKGPLFKLLKENNAGIFYGGSGEKLAEELLLVSKDKQILTYLKSRAFHTYENFLDGRIIYDKFINYLESLAQKNFN